MPVTTNRRSLLKAVAGMGAAAQIAGAAPQSTATGRDYWVGLLARLAEPVLGNLAAGTLKRKCPWSAPPARGLAGASTPIWRPSRDCWRAWRRGSKPRSTAVRNATGNSDRRPRPRRHPFRDRPRFARFPELFRWRQPVVDCGFLAQALLRAPSELWRNSTTARSATWPPPCCRRGRLLRATTTGCCSAPWWRPRWP